MNKATSFLRFLAMGVACMILLTLVGCPTLPSGEGEGEGEVQCALTVSVSPPGSGTVFFNPSGGLYDEGDVVNLGAVPYAGWRFAYWTGNVLDTGAASTAITMTADETITALFWEDTVNGGGNNCIRFVNKHDSLIIEKAFIAGPATTLWDCLDGEFLEPEELKEVCDLPDGDHSTFVIYRREDGNLYWSDRERTGSDFGEPGLNVWTRWWYGPEEGDAPYESKRALIE